MEAFLSQWQVWLALAVIIGGVKLLDACLGAYRNAKDDAISERLSNATQLCAIRTFTGAPSGYDGRFHPSGNLDCRLDETNRQIGLMGERLNQIIKNFDHKHETAIQNGKQNYEILRDAILEIGKQVREFEAAQRAIDAALAQKCCAEKPAKAPAPKPATTTRRTR